MKTKALVLGFALSICSTVKAQYTVELQDGHDNYDNDRHIKEIPIIKYDLSNVSIESKHFIDKVKVVITDTMGRVIYNKVISIGPDNNVLDIPKEYVSDKFKIELSYDNAKLQGYFLQAF